MTVNQAMQLAFQHQEAGRLAEAQALCRQILAAKPNHPGALYLLGLISLRSGHFAEAAAAFRQVIQLEPTRADVHNNLANVLMHTGQLEEAVSVFTRAAELNPDEPAIQSNLGYALSSVGRYDDAIIALNRAVKLNPDDAEAHNNLGIARRGAGLLDHAIASYRRAIQLKPDYAEAHNNLGNALRANRQLDDAIATYKRAIECKPNYPEAYNNLGNLHAAEGKFDEAIAAFTRAVQIRPNFFEAQYSLANALRDAGRFDESLDVFDRAVQLNPDYPDVRLNRSLVLLLRGDYARGLPEYEWRWKVKDLPAGRSFAQPVWDGSDLNGKTILIHNEQGFGDTIQCLRFIPLIAARGGRVILGCPLPLARLLSQFTDIVRIVTDGDPMPDFDFHCPMMSLPFVFKTELNSIPPPLILKSDSAAAERWKQRLAADPSPRKIGLSWAGNPTHTQDRHRSINLSQFALLAGLKEAAFFSLQFGEAAKQNPPAGLILHDFTGELKDFADTAALIANLDLVLTVDTAVAHLAGSMGKAVWILLPFKPDWRWLLKRDDSPWYPTVRLFRQNAIGDWGGVMSHVATSFHRHLSSPELK